MWSGLTMNRAEKELRAGVSCRSMRHYCFKDAYYILDTDRMALPVLGRRRLLTVVWCVDRPFIRADGRRKERQSRDTSIDTRRVFPGLMWLTADAGDANSAASGKAVKRVERAVPVLAAPDSKGHVHGHKTWTGRKRDRRRDGMVGQAMIVLTAGQLKQVKNLDADRSKRKG